jgi:hypothetical protein
MSPARRRPQGEPESFVNFEDAASMADPAVSALLNQAQRRQEEAHLPRREREKKKKEREKIRARRPYHTTYDIPLELRQRIKQLAERHGVPASQLATLGLLRFVEDLAEDKVDVDAYKVASRSPRYDFNLAEEYLATFGQPVRRQK